MLNDVDESLRNLLRAEALEGTDVEVVLDAPTRDWAARRNAPTVDVYLYDIREDTSRRFGNTVTIRREDGKVAGYRSPPRVFRLAYLVTAWTQRPDDEHRLLSALMACLVSHDVLPADAMTPALAAQGYPVSLSIAQPPPDNRKVPDIWSSLGGDLKPSLDVIVTLTVDVGLFKEAAAEIMKPLKVKTTGHTTFPDLDDGERESKLPPGFPVPGEPAVPAGASSAGG